MMSSRTHAGIDVGLLAGLAAVVLTPRSPPAVRLVAAAALAAQAGAMAVTDYEAGLRPLVSFRQHRRFDLAGGALLALAGAAVGSRSLFTAAATAVGAAVVSDRHGHHAPSTLYLPLDTPKAFGPDMWLVDSAIGPGLPVRMTVIRLSNGDVLLHSPTRMTAGLRRDLEDIGPIRHLVAPNSVHWMFMKDWQDAVPQARTFGAPGLRRRGQVKRAGLRIDEDLSDTAPAEWGGAFEQVVVPGGGGFHEVAMLHRPSRTVLMTDLVQNLESGKLPWALRPAAWLLGNMSPTSRAPTYLRALVRLGGGPAMAAAARIVAWRPERVVVTHGAPILEGAAERLRGSLRWLTAE